ARAAGQPYRAEPELLEAARSFLEQFASPDAPAGPDVPFGPSRQPPGNSSPLDRVIALAGRDAAWSPA
ncbi:MAG TPA: TIGR03086 family protein, partial [Streptosporangiaceae bacterium]|nr:TIGR03086 family protein [Streptosporangiaceae bacterium]